MTCVWDSMVKGLTEVFRKASVKKGRADLFDLVQPILTKDKFIDFCMKHCDCLITKRTNLIWNGEEISEHEMKTHHIPRIRELDSTEKRDGYNIGACDSFLIFICICFGIDINYIGPGLYPPPGFDPNQKSKPIVRFISKPTTITYKNKLNTGKSFTIKSNEAHASYVSSQVESP